MGFVDLFTMFTCGRELYIAHSPDGRDRSAPKKFAGIGGHYQVSAVHGRRIGTFFNRHPGGVVNQRTDLYCMETSDGGRTWTTVDGRPLTAPLSDPDNPARVEEYSSRGLLVYGNDLAFTADGRPAMFYIVSRDWKPGPEAGPREWKVTAWTGREWATTTVTASDHNYDMGSLYIHGDDWRMIGPSDPGPQPWATGGELVLWRSRDDGRTWARERAITAANERNHFYPRRPLNAHDPFFAFWADGRADAMSESHLWFCNSDGSRVYRLPWRMEGE